MLYKLHLSQIPLRRVGELIHLYIYHKRQIKNNDNNNMPSADFRWEINANAVRVEFVEFWF